MRKVLTVAATAIMTAGCTMAGETGSSASLPPTPRYELRAADGSSRGTVTLIQAHGEMGVLVDVHGLPPGVHGAHIHAVGRCDPPDFTTAGPHWNPTGRQHGSQNPQGPHLGDLPNLTVGADGRGRLEFRVPNARVRTGASPLQDADGAAFVIHASGDDYRSDPSGNSSARIACAVLG